MNYQSLKLNLQVLPSDFPNKNRPKTLNNPYHIPKITLGHCNITFWSILTIFPHLVGLLNLYCDERRDIQWNIALALVKLCQVSRAICRVSGVRCQVSLVSCEMSEKATAGDTDHKMVRIDQKSNFAIAYGFFGDKMWVFRVFFRKIIWKHL